MMNVPNYPVQNTTQTQAQTYQQPVYTQQPAYYPQVNYQTVPTPAYSQQYVYPQTQQAAPVQQPQQAMQAPQIPQVDTSRIAVQLTSDLVAECAALVELNKLAVNVTKEIEQTQDPQKKARLQTHAQDLNQLIAMREAKVNQLQAQCKQYE